MVAQNPFGVLIGKTEGRAIGLDRALAVARKLGAGSVRTRIWLERWNGSDAACAAIKAAGLKLVLNVNAAQPTNGPKPFPTDLVDYRRKLREILTLYHPDLLTVENEEDNPLYHTGGVADYFAELKAAVEVAHPLGIKVTNGGITSPVVARLSWADAVARGQADSANVFAQKVFADRQIAGLADATRKDDRLRFASALLDSIRTLPLDYINFHWYAPARGLGGRYLPEKLDYSVLRPVTAFLQRASGGKPVVNTEVGQLHAAPDIVTGLLGEMQALHYDYIIWYSGDGGDGKAIALQNADGTLRPNGEAFRAYVAAQVHP